MNVDDDLGEVEADEEVVSEERDKTICARLVFTNEQVRSYYFYFV